MSDTIQFTCPHCNHQMKLPSSTVGKQGKCPSCSAVITITASQPTNPSANEVQVAPGQPVAAPGSPQPVQRVQQQAPAAVASLTPQPASAPRKSRWKLLCVTHILAVALTIGLMPYWKPHLEPFFPADYLAQNSTEDTTPEPELAAAADIEESPPPLGEDDLLEEEMLMEEFEGPGPEAPPDAEDAFPSTPRPDPLADMNLVIDIIVLNCAQSYDNVKMEFELVNRSKVLLSYVGVNGKFMDLEGAYLGREFTNETNVRGGKSVILTFNLENVQVDEIGSWELSFSDVNIDLGDGIKREAVTHFKLNEILGSVQHVKTNEVVLENELAGHWQGGSDSSVFLSPKTGRYTVSDGGQVQKFWIIKRDYSRRQVVARRQFAKRLDLGGGEYLSGIEMTYFLDDTSSMGVVTSGFLGSKTGDRWLQVEVDDLTRNTRIDNRTQP